MIPTANVKFFDNVSTPQVSREYNNDREDVMMLEITTNGTNPTFSLNVQAIVDDKEDEWSVISGIEMSAYELTAGGAVTKKGIYQYGVSGVGKLKVSLNSISGGSISVFARIGAETL